MTKGAATVIYSNSKRISLERMSAEIISLKDRIQQSAYVNQRYDGRAHVP